MCGLSFHATPQFTTYLIQVTSIETTAWTLADHFELNAPKPHWLLLLVNGTTTSYSQSRKKFVFFSNLVSTFILMLHSERRIKEVSYESYLLSFVGEFFFRRWQWWHIEITESVWQSILADQNWKSRIKGWLKMFTIVCTQKRRVTHGDLFGSASKVK